MTWFKRQVPWVALAWSVAAIAVAVLTNRPAVAIVLLAAGMMVVVMVSVFRALATLMGETPLPEWAYEAAETDTTELARDRMRLLRGLKDLEYERDVGRVSAEDFEAQRGQYQDQLVAVMASLDRKLEPFVKRAEKDIEERLRRAPAAPARDSADASAKTAAEAAQSTSSLPLGCATCGAALAVDSVFCKKCGARVVPSSIVCGACKTENDPDSVFCKKCGKRVADEPRA